MSIGIVVATTEFVLLVADGRLSNAYAALANDAKKIVPIHDSLSVIEFGVALGSQPVVQNLKEVTELQNNGESVVDMISNSVHAAGAAIVDAVIPESCDMSTIKVGMLAVRIAWPG